MMNDLVILKLDSAKRALVEAKTIQETKKILDISRAAEIYAKRQKLGEDAISYATSIKVEALRQLGMMLKETERADGGDAQRTRFQKSTESPPTLSELGIDKKISSLSQKIADLTDEEIEKVKTGTAIARVFKENRRNKNKELLKNIQEISDDIYQVIYADPPWQYNDKQNIDNLGGAEKHYPTMSINELCEMKIPKTKDNAVLFLWTTAPILEDAFKIINTWNFKYKAHFIWDKVQHNMGHYNSVRHELLLIATKGNCLPDNVKLFDSVQTIEKTKKHSEKPTHFYEIIETLYKGKKIELFARNKREGWDSWGNE